MPDLTVSTTQPNKGVRLLRGQDDIMHQLGTFQAGEALVSGDVVSLGTDNKMYKADANGTGNLLLPRGVVVEDIPSGSWGTLFDHVTLAGYSGLANAGAQLYLSDTAGKIGTAAGTTSIVVGWGYRKDGLDVVRIKIAV
jgi:hypothetical protein